MLIECAPGGVEAVVVTVSTELPDPLTVAGLNVALEPAGSPATLRETAPVKPFREESAMVNEVSFPCVRFWDVGLGVKEN